MIPTAYHDVITDYGLCLVWHEVIVVDPPHAPPFVRAVIENAAEARAEFCGVLMGSYERPVTLPEVLHHIARMTDSLDRTDNFTAWATCYARDNLGIDELGRLTLEHWRLIGTFYGESIMAAERMERLIGSQGVHTLLVTFHRIGTLYSAMEHPA